MALDSHLEAQIVAALRRILRAISIQSHRLRSECGLTGPQLLALRAVADAEELTVSALASRIYLSQSTTSELLRRLALQGLVELNEGDDRRSKVVRVTPEGEQRAKDAPSLLQQPFQAELERREDYEQTRILATLQEIAAMMETEDVGAAPVPTSKARSRAS
jgi:DNA-binding MarR family transcriptional regulator